MKNKKFAILVAFLTIFGLTTARAQSLGDLLGGLGDMLGGNSGSTIGNVLEGVFSSSNITIADMEGEWTSSGPAVCFQGEGFLKKAGGVAAAAAVETKLAPYYEQYGLNNATLTIDAQGNFQLVCKMIRLSGNITQAKGAEPGVFEFNFTALGMKLTSVTTYVQMTSRSMDVMFDATKLKKLLSAISQFSGIQVVKALSSILDSYDGLCVGFHFSGTKVNQNDSNGFGLGNILNGLGGGNSNRNSNTGKGTTNSGKSSTNSGKGTTNSGKSSTNNGNNSSTGLDLLRGILNGGKN